MRSPLRAHAYAFSASTFNPLSAMQHAEVMLKSSNLSKQIKYTSKYSKHANRLTPVKQTNGVNFYCKGKAIPLQAWTGPKGSRRFRIPDFKTIATRRW